jgi:hypothetical protein
MGRIVMTEWRPDLASLTPSGDSLGLVVAWRSGKKLGFGQVNLSEGVGTELRNQGKRFAAEVEGREPRSFSPEGVLEAEEYFAVPTAAITDSFAIRENCVAPANLPLLTADQLGRKALLFYAVVLGSGDAAVIYVSKSNPARIARQGLLVTSMHDSLTKVEDPIFLLNPVFDLAITCDGILVLEQSAFELLYRDTPAVREAAGGWIADLATHLPMDAEDQARLVVHAERDSRLRRRLRAINERGHLRDVSIADIRSEINRQGLEEARYLSDDRLTWDETDTPTLLKILNEDLFIGGLSKVPFSADRKSARA